ncbi:methylated-DNA--[protein]-cysteine S-methyltransferase [Virgibacillus halodenitrificans]|uniref:methylated-DNA--[protein]-cysteine S-methyltransferase n=1 Tax=Virgibacillus halodenitrificans TaxID=1482 RepID=UPI00136D4392|nr:methylated-DNA--[protein]-cysteine S-methyltransferase [Virgibacillus halodenitrificans]MYL46888.1 methylated-DNA--[protein]-cysteine S-methyltransferase [Virgibacillus halodenitrificans]
MKKITLFYDEMESPIGTLLLLSDGEAIVRIEYGRLADLEEKLATWAKRFIGEPYFVHQPELIASAKEELDAYFKHKKQTFSISFKFYGTSFQQKVWQALYDCIGYKETKTYKEIAEIIGNPKAVRAVGGAVNKNPFSIVVPCHRVIGANGKLVGYNGGLDKKEFLLKHEATD